LKYDENLKSYGIFEFWNFIYKKYILKFFETFELLIFFCGKFGPPTNGISTSLPMEYQPSLPMVYRSPTYGILTPLPMVYRPPYPWYFDPPIHGILTPLPMVYWPPYPWYINPPIHGILTPLPIEYWPPYTWYVDLPAYLLIRNGGVQNTMGVQFTIQGGSVFNKGFNIPWM
jgi:hypothetical protein